MRPTARGIVVLAGAALAYAASWTFGTRELAILALGLLLTALAALALVVVARRGPSELSRRLPARSSAGEPLEAAIVLEPAPPFVAASLVDASPGLGDPVASLERGRRLLTGPLARRRATRGRYALAPALVLEDPFGLVRARVPLARPGLVRVEPQLVSLAGPRASVRRRGDARRTRAATGEELAGVRDHEVGEPLRRVHWGTSARRGRLTVRELEERARGELAIVLDGASAGAGDAFELAVRVAGSLAQEALRAGIAVSFSCTGRVAGAARARAARAMPELWPTRSARSRPTAPARSPACCGRAPVRRSASSRAIPRGSSPSASGRCASAGSPLAIPSRSRSSAPATTRPPTWRR